MSSQTKSGNFSKEFKPDLSYQHHELYFIQRFNSFVKFTDNFRDDSSFTKDFLEIFEMHSNADFNIKKF